MSCPRIAIDFGTTRTKVAYYNAAREQAQLIELGLTQREIIPSLWHVPREGEGDISVGDNAAVHLDRDPGGIVREIKREIDKIGKRRVGAGRLKPTRVELATAMLGMIRYRCQTEVFHGQTIADCTLTVPVVYTQTQRDRLVDAARAAGWRDIRLMEEPAAAARAWLEHGGERMADHFVVVDIGGGTTDLTAVQWSQDHFAANPAIAPAGFAQGGNDIDDAACTQLMDQYGDEIEDAIEGQRESFLVKLRGVKESFARGLKKQTVAAGSEPIEITSEAFENAEREYRGELRSALQTFLSDCRAAAVTQPAILLIGGASKMRGLREDLDDLAPGKVFSWDRADYAVVLGAVDFPGKQSTAQSQKQRKAIESYRVALRAAVADDQVTSKEGEHLTSLGEELEIDLETLEELQIEVLGCSLQERLDTDRPSEGDAKLIEQIDRLITAKDYEAANDLLQVASADDPAPAYTHRRIETAIHEGKLHLAKRLASGRLQKVEDDVEAKALLIVASLLDKTPVFDQINPSEYMEADRYGLDATFSWLAYNAAELGVGLVDEFEAVPAHKLRFFGDAGDIDHSIQMMTIALGLKFHKSEVVRRYATPEHDEQLDKPASKAIKLARLFGIEVTDLSDVKRRRGALLQVAREVGGDAEHVFSIYMKGHSDGQHLLEEGNAAELHQLMLDALDRLANASQTRNEAERAFPIQVFYRLCELDPAQKTFSVNELLDRLRLIKDANRPKADSTTLESLIVPSVMYSHNCGAVINDLTVTNHSPFTLKSLRLELSYSTGEGNQKTWTEFVNQLKPHESKRWNNIFVETGFFGSKTSNIVLEARSGNYYEVRCIA